MSDRYSRYLTYSSGSYRIVIPSKLIDDKYDSAIFQYAQDIDEIKDEDIVIRFD